jgi:predicted MFS family arabinose efflux permease
MPPRSIGVDRPDRSAGLRRSFLWWHLLSAMTFRGYWLVTSVYLVVVADLSPFELVFLGTAMELTVFVCEVPTGVMADTISRKWSIVVSHVLMGVGMLTTALVTEFPALVAAQMLWGVGWTFSSGADVAWITDELDDAGQIDRVLASSARWRYHGAIAGLVACGALAWATELWVAIAAAGVGMLALGGLVVVRFTEHHFTPTREHRFRESLAVFRRGATLARRDHEIFLVLTATLLINSGAEAFDRLHPKRLIDLGFPDAPDPVVWFTVLGVAGLVVASLALRVVEARIDTEGMPRRALMLACAAGVLGMLALAHAPNVAVGIAGSMIVSGVAWSLIRSVSSIWVNRRATSDVRATVQSFLGQTESIGEISGGLVMAVLAQTTSITVALTLSAALLGTAGLVIAHSHAGRASAPEHRAVRASGHVA